MQYTGERFIPNGQDAIGLEHYSRYQYALSFVKGKKVLDIACGEGYGCNILAQKAKIVYGCDISQEAIENASKKYAAIKFSKQSIEKLSFKDNSFDVITCFETIEHISFAAQQNALKELKRVLKTDGIILISTPNIQSSLWVPNKYHLCEHNLADFEKLLSKFFNQVTIMKQYICYCSVIVHSISQTSNQPNFQIGNNPIDDARYFIAICSPSTKEILPLQKKYEEIAIDGSNTILSQLCHIKRKINWLIPIYNNFIDILAIIVSPFGNLKTKITRHRI